MFSATLQRKRHLHNWYKDVLVVPHIKTNQNDEQEIWFTIKHENRFFNVSFDEVDYFDNIKVKDCDGTWYIFDAKIYNDKIYFLCESEQLGDELCHIIIDTESNLILDGVYNGFDDFEDYLLTKGGDI